MTHLTDKPNAVQPYIQRRATEPAWLWLALAGGSIAIHLLAVAILLPIASHASIHEQSLDVSPIDFVELPGTKNSASIKAAIAPAPSPVAPPPAPVAQNNAGDTSNVGDIGLASPVESPITPVVEPSVEPSVEPAIAPSAESLTPKPPTAEQPTPETPAPETAASAPPSQSSTPGATSQQAAPGQVAPGQVAPGSGSQATAPASPPVTTERISIAVPDTSVQYAAENQPIPLTLTASLQVIAVPPEQLENPPPDAIAQPTRPNYTFEPNPKATICVPESESAQFTARLTLGAEVGVQVETNETGQVIDTTVWQSSQNPLNDQLATCLVKNWNWDFRPAIAQGKPVASKALVVRVKIDRS